MQGRKKGVLLTLVLLTERWRRLPAMRKKVAGEVDDAAWKNSCSCGQR
jgi:hypothetical protein